MNFFQSIVGNVKNFFEHDITKDVKVAGQIIEPAVVQTVLSKVGIEPSAQGAVSYLDDAITGAVASEDNLNDQEKQILAAALTGVANKIKL
jgi:hypothetical protein